MEKLLKFTINKVYFGFAFILVFALFLSAVLPLLLGKPTSRDIPPMASFGVLYFIVITLYVKRYLNAVKNGFIALELNENGIIDHIYNVKVAWDNVLDICFVNSGRNRYISIVVFDQKQVTGQTKNIFKKLVFYTNAVLTRSPVKILPIYIKGKNADIFNEMYAYFEERKIKINNG